MRDGWQRPWNRKAEQRSYPADRHPYTLWARSLDDPLSEVGWMLEELRVSQFARGLGVHGPVSVKRIRKALES